MTEHTAIRSSSQRGFNLIELSVVVTIISVMVATAMPSYNQVTHGYRLRNDADNLMGLITLARMRAASKFARSRVTCDTTTNTCTISSKQPSDSSWPSTANEPQKIVLSQGISFAIPTGTTTGAGGQSGITPAQGTTGQTNPYYVEFSSRGLPIDDSGNPVNNYAFYLQDQQYGTATAVAMDYSGQAKVYNRTSSAYSVRQE